MSENTIAGIEIEVVEYDPAKAEINLKENDWSHKSEDGKGEDQ